MQIPAQMLGTTNSMPIEEVSHFEDERERVARPPAKYPNAKIVFRLWPGRPMNWNINRYQLQAAENLFLERGMESLKDAIEWYDDMYKKWKHDKFFPVVNSPFDLDSKWDKLEAFNDKHA